jgi:ANTAR domain
MSQSQAPVPAAGENGRMHAIGESSREHVAGRSAAAALDAAMRDGSPPREELAAAQLLIRQLEDALLSRTVIGQAEERHRISADEAFTRLRSCSQPLNRKLRDVARDPAETGEQPFPDTVLDDRAAR